MSLITNKKELQLLTPKQMLKGFPIAYSQAKAGNIQKIY